MAGILHATIEEVEPGLFRALYPSEFNGPGTPPGGGFPDSHIGTSRETVRTWVEEMALGMGYQRVEWH